MRICVIGVGAVGGYFGGRLAEAGVDVVFVARGESHDHLVSHGLRVESLCGDFRIRPVHVVRTPADAGAADAVLLAVKAWQVPEIAHSLRPLVDAGAFLVPLQNGVESPLQLAGVLGRDAVVGGYCRIGSVAIGPAHIRHAWHAFSAPLLAVGELGGGGSGRVERLLGQLGRARGLEARLELDIERALWSKFVFLAAYGGVGAVEQAPIGVLRDQPRTRALLLAAIEEAARVGRGRGVALPQEIAAESMKVADALPPASIASMHRDIAARRPSELDALVGAVNRLGREAGIATPLFDAFEAALRPLEAAARAALRAGAETPSQPRTAAP